ncbi:hypothetical protein GGI42DRAFT_147433 [Trichoderma sp. SZMC 28013]
MTYRPRNGEGMYVGSQSVSQSRPAMSWMVSRACACPSMHVLRERQSWIWIPTPCALASRPWLNLHATRPFACAVVIPKKKRRLLLRPEECHTNYTRRSVPLSRWPTSRSMVGWIWFGLLVVVRLRTKPMHCYSLVVIYPLNHPSLGPSLMPL